MRTLPRVGNLSDYEAKVLHDSYVFLRSIEDRLQMVDKRQLSALPADPEALNQLARRLGYATDGGAEPAGRLTADYTERTESVRELFYGVFDRLGATP